MMRDSDGNGSRSVSQVNSTASDLHGDPTNRWNIARQRYANLWSGAVLQDWFSVYVYPSSDSEFLREIDFASEEPEIAKAIGEAVGTDPKPQDLLISLNWRMGNRNEPNDPEIWAAIDAGQFVCFTHFGTADRRMGWEQRNLLLAAAATVVLMAHPQGRLMTYSQINGTSAETSSIPKVSLLTNYLLSAAAGECYLDDGPMQDPKILLARLSEDHETTWNTVEAMASIALEKPIDWYQGPMATAEIAQKAAELLTEAYRQVVVPDIAPITLRTAQGSGQRSAA
jgi:hypothetical protein